MTVSASEFERTIAPHMRAAYDLARWLVRNQADAEDVVQEAYVRAFRHFGSFRGERARAWLLAIVRNACWSFLTRNRTDAESAFDEEQQAGAVVSLQIVPEPDAQLLRADQARRIQEEVSALRPEFREAFVLRELEGLSYKEIADVTAVPIGTVMSRLSRARQELQARLAGESRKAGAL